jgi:hypothetical protein
MSCDGGHLGYKIYKVLDYPIINNVQFGFHQLNSLDCFWENVFFVFFPLGPMLKICHENGEKKFPQKPGSWTQMLHEWPLDGPFQNWFFFVSIGNPWWPLWRNFPYGSM